MLCEKHFVFGKDWISISDQGEFGRELLWNRTGLVVLFVSIIFGLLVLRDFINILLVLAISRLLVWGCKGFWFDSSFGLVLDPEIEGFFVVCVGFQLNLSISICSPFSCLSSFIFVTVFRADCVRLCRSSLQFVESCSSSVVVFN